MTMQLPDETQLNVTIPRRLHARWTHLAKVLSGSITARLVELLQRDLDDHWLEVKPSYNSIYGEEEK